MTDHPGDVAERLAKAEAHTAALQALCETLLVLADPSALQQAWAQVMAKWQLSMVQVSTDTAGTPADSVQLAYLRSALVQMERLVNGPD